jgi:hypothetical protein
VAQGRGALFVVSKDTEPFYIEYDPNTDTISTTQINIRIRDFDGVVSTEGGVAITDTTNPTTLDRSHEYNLKNQGYDAFVVKDAAAPSTRDPVSIWSDTGAYPGNDKFFLFGFMPGADSSNVPIPNVRHWNPVNIVNNYNAYTGNTKPPKGHFILNPFDRDRDNPTGRLTSWLSSGSIPRPIDKNRPTAVAFYAGRVWYTGTETNWVSATDSPNNHNVFFSQILTDLKKASNCFQDGDPTAEDANELLSNDGGIIRIPEVGSVKRLQVIQQYLVVYADNGVWTISGDVDSGFRADNFQVRRISEIGVLSPQSVVNVEGKALFWSDGGIYVLATDELGVLQIQNITESTIQTYFNSIPYQARKYSWGNYDPFQRKVQWLFTDDSEFDGGTDRFKYNSILEFDTVLQAFNKHKISEASSSTPYLSGFIQTPSSVRAVFTLNVTDQNGDLVVDASGETVTVDRTSSTQDATSSNTFYLTLVPDGSNYRYTFSKFKNLSFVDWQTFDGVGANYISYLETGVELFGDMVREKRAHRLWMYFARTETGYEVASLNNWDFQNPSGCYVSTRWDFSGSGSSGKWSPRKQMYRLPPSYHTPEGGDTENFDFGFDVIVAEDSLRGSGKGVSLYIESEAGKDMVLLGWAMEASLMRRP